MRPTTWLATLSQTKNMVCKIPQTFRTGKTSTSVFKKISFMLGAFLLLLAFTPRPSLAAYPWEKKPGPIQGRWRVSCPASGDMVIEFTVKDNKASGRIAKLGAAGKYGYKPGEEVFKLTGTDLGKWVGQLKWRSVAGAERWDPISFIAAQNELDAIMTTDECYKRMARTR